MKKVSKHLLIVSGLFFVFATINVGAQILSQKKLVNHLSYIEILDTSAIDTTYAPIFIQKSNVTHITTNRRDKSGGVVIHFSDGITSRAIELSHQEFNDYDDNSTLRDWLEDKIFGTSEQLYTYKFANDTMTIDPADNIVAYSVLAHPSNTGDIYVEGRTGTLDGFSSSDIPLDAGYSLSGGLLIAVSDTVIVSSRAAADTCIVSIAKK